MTSFADRLYESAVSLKTVDREHGGSTPRLRYQIMGPLRVLGGREGSSISAHKMEVLLAVLLTRAGQVVPLDQLVSEVWGGNPPLRARAAVHVYVSQLRRFLSVPGRTESPIVTKAPGYLLDIGSDELDLESFHSAVRRGRGFATDGRHDLATESFHDALLLWRGPALEGLCDSPAISAFVTWLEEIRLDCAEAVVESSFALGRHRDMVGFLRQLVAEHPLRETFHRQLMLALYRSERQADALKVYAAARQTLNRELGLEPCRALQHLHRAILSDNDDLHAGEAA
ncbi:AfsR/SARP family transcriptional regulator [Actinoplanes sp. CA-051413]|uniref:AfsR/SARP family transcriptional regulator n=1 Tax=Actinoplanes sp. CA-051413 TaxID=3239899 RepID=UPI003D959A62